MSWLARSFANSLRLDDDENDVASVSSHDASPSKRDEQDNYNNDDNNTLSIEQQQREIQKEEETQARGVKEDLTELKQTLTRQLWGVASFLAPPPPSDRNLINQPEASDQDLYNVSRIGGDFEEIGERFSEMRYDNVLFGSEENENENNVEEEEEEVEVIGITDEVLAFARNIAMHPETWLDFPLDEEEDLDDFDMSSAQREHALAIEQLAPRLAALRIELCPCHMTESYFWKVYFVLLHSRLNKHDAEILSTPQVMEARALWMQELHKQTKLENDWGGGSTTYENDRSNAFHEDFGYSRTFHLEPTTSRATEYEMEKHPVIGTDMEFVDKSIIEEKPAIKLESKDPLVGRSSKVLVPDYEDDYDDWPDEEDSDLGSYKATIPLGNEEDFSFSDLEDDINSPMTIKPKTVSKAAETSTS